LNLGATSSHWTMRWRCWRRLTPKSEVVELRFLAA
jgi:hypothetical protein